HGFLVGSVGLAVTGHADCPVVLVREPMVITIDRYAPPWGMGGTRRPPACDQPAPELVEGVAP
ncbi:universal stress protein, partial [Streptomyces seoulensis]